MIASVTASRGFCRMMIDAPTSGMKMGTLTGMRSAIAATKCPISCTKMRKTMPAANFQFR